MEPIKITNTDPIGLYVSLIITDPTCDKRLLEYQRQANQAIKEYSSKPANRENCLNLKRYLEHSLALCNICPNSDGKDELAQALESVIATLQSGIDREEKYYQKPADKDESEKWTQAYRLQEAKKRWEQWGYLKRPIKTDINTLEGFLRTIPGIATAHPVDVTTKYGKLIRDRYFPESRQLPNNKEVLKNWIDNVFLTNIIQTLAFVQLTSQQITEQRIINIYAENDSPNDTPATAGA